MLPRSRAMALILGVILSGCVGDRPTLEDGPEGDTPGAPGRTAGADADTARGKDPSNGNPNPLQADAGASTDAGGALSTSPCRSDEKFAGVMNLKSINTGQDDAYARLTADEKTMYFSQLAAGSGWTIEVATRVGPNMPFVRERRLPLEAGSSAATPARDGRLFYAYDDTSSNPDGDPQVFYATQPYGPATSHIVSDLNSPLQDTAPYIAPDGSSLYLARRPHGQGKPPGNLFVAYLSATDRFTTPVEVAELNTEADESVPVISADGLNLYFASDRPGGIGKGDVYVASRPDLTSKFGPAVPVAEVNSEADESPSWISPDNCTLYLTSDRAGGAGRKDIYWASRR